MRRPYRVHRRTQRFLIASGLVVALIASSGAAWALFSGTGAQTSTATAGSLNTPAGLTSTHPNVTGSGDGNVTLAWSDTLNIDQPVTYYIFREPSAASVTPPVSPASPGDSWVQTSFSPVTNTGSNSRGQCTTTGSVPNLSVSCVFTDSAVYNSQYVYDVMSVVGGWKTASAADMALSLPPTSGKDYSGGSDPNLNAVQALGNSNILAVGDNCTLLFSAGTTWSTVSLNSVCTGYNLTGINVLDASDGWIVGSNGTNGLVLSCSSNCNTSAGVWQKATTATLPSLMSVTAASQADGAGKQDFYVYAGGAGGNLIACQVIANAADACAGTGGTWNAFVPTGFSGVTFTGVSTVSNNGNNIWAVGSTNAGANGFLAVCTEAAHGTSCGVSPGTGWTAAAHAPTTNAYRSVLATSNTQVYATGAGGTLLLCTTSCNDAANGLWPTDESGIGSSDSVTGIYVKDATHAFAVTEGGLAYNCAASCNAAGISWVQQTVVDTGAPALNDIAGGDATHVWAVGDTGTILFFPTTNYWGQQASGVSSYALASADLTSLANPDGTLYTTQVPWATGAVIPGGGCSGGNQGVLVKFAPTIPSGISRFTVRAATVVKATGSPGAGAGYALSIFDGSAWTTGATSPLTTNLTTATVDFSAQINTPTKLSSMQLCLQAVSGTSGSVKTAIDLLHVDVDSGADVTATPTSGASVASVTLAGGGFTAGSSTVASLIDTTGTLFPNLVTKTTDGSGNLPSGMSFSIPSGAAAGSAIIRVDDASGRRGIASFTVLYSATDTVASSLNPAQVGSPVTYTATVSGTGPTPTGTVTFEDAGVPISTCGSSGVVTLSGGVATCTVTYSATGSPSITAPYSGDSNYASSTSNTVNETVTSGQLHISVLTGSGGAVATGHYQGTITLTVVNQAGSPVGGVAVTGSWSPTSAATPSGCTTVSGTGSCTITTTGGGGGSFPAGQPENWSASNLALTGYTYDSVSNVDGGNITIGDTAAAPCGAGTVCAVKLVSTTDTTADVSNTLSLGAGIAAPKNSTVEILIFRESKAGDTVTFGTSPTLTTGIPSAVNSNNFITGTTTAGSAYNLWVYQGTGSGTTGGSITLNFGQTNAATSIEVLVLTGNDNTAPIRKSNGTDSGTTTTGNKGVSLTLSSPVTSGDGELALLGVNADQSGTWSPPSGWSQLDYQHAASLNNKAEATNATNNAVASVTQNIVNAGTWGAIELEISHA